jgi:cytochrome c peroxidase
MRRVFFHNGQFKSLRNVIRFYNTRDTNPELWYPVVKGVVQKFNDLPAMYRANIDTQAPLDGKARGSKPSMSDQDVEDLETFLGTLTDADATKLNSAYAESSGRLASFSAGQFIRF